MTKHMQSNDLATTWNITTGDDIWVLGKNASIEVGDDVAEQYGIDAGNGTYRNLINIRGDVTATAPLSDVAVNLGGALNTLHIFESSTLTASTGIFSTSTNALIRNEGTIDASQIGVYAQGTKELVNSGDISGQTGVYSVNGGLIVNSGKIDAIDGIFAEGAIGKIINGKDGVITGGHAGISIDTDTSRVVNHGRIVGGEFGYAVMDGDGSMTLVNRGTLDGHILMGGGSDVFDTRRGTFDHVVAGGDGSDVYKTSSASIQIQEALNDGYDKVASTVSFKLGDNVEGLTLLGKRDVNGEGNDLANTLVGNNGDNRLTGGDSDDVLSGGAGTDILRGGIGDDFFTFRKNSDIEIVKDFSDGDFLVLDFIEAYDLDNLFANHLEKVGNDLVITYGDDKLILENTKLNELTQGDFGFV